MRVHITIEGESNAENAHDLAQLRGLLADQMPRLEFTSASFGVGIRDVGLVALRGDYSEDLDALSVPELAEMAEERGVEVNRADGRTDLEPKKADYVSALS